MYRDYVVYSIALCTYTIQSIHHTDHRRKSSSMYEVFNWGYSNDEPPKRFSLSIVGSEINIDDPPTATVASATAGNTRTYAAHHHHHQYHHHHHHTQQHQQSSNNYGSNNINVHRQNVVTENARIASGGGAAAAATTTCNSVGNTNKTATAAAATTFNYSSKTGEAVRHTNPMRRFITLCSARMLRMFFQRVSVFLLFCVLITNSPVSWNAIVFFFM